MKINKGEIIEKYLPIKISIMIVKYNIYFCLYLIFYGMIQIPSAIFMALASNNEPNALNYRINKHGKAMIVLV